MGVEHMVVCYILDMEVEEQSIIDFGSDYVEFGLLSVRRKFKRVSVTTKTSQLECRLESVTLITSRLSCRVERHNLWMNIKSRSFRREWRRKNINSRWSQINGVTGLVSKRRGHWAGLLRLQRSSTSLKNDGVIGFYDFDGGGPDICIAGVPASSNSDRQMEYVPNSNAAARALEKMYKYKKEFSHDLLTLVTVKLLDDEDALSCAARHEYCWYYPTTKLGNLSFLVSLDLSYNNFHGELPPEFSHLRRLRDIDLSYNNFTGEIPIGIATLPSLKASSLGSNELLNGSNALSIFNVSTLEYLDLSNVGLTGDLPSDLGRHTPGLQALGLDSNM
ncbi:hypothetical protein BC332_04352 [Capsicum chinense]|nr:hypothetical protein BC332_04352 [Capsicum chinense]